MFHSKKTARYAAAVSTFFFTLLLYCVCAFAGTTPSLLVELDLNENTKVYGLTALDSLGKKTGTLKEFADSVINDNVKSYTIFPASYFNAYDDTKEIVGGIYSRGEIIRNDFFDVGVGFDEKNNFYLFSLPSYITNMTGQNIITQDAFGNDVEVITAFNCYPWLIKNYNALEITPTPGATLSFINQNARRAFMGQSADGTFMYGIIPGATIHETQTACVNLGLINAVNVDGGASCGIYQDGKYLANPGRELASVVCIIEEKVPVVEAAPLSANVFVNGTQLNFDAYEINGGSYFKLRDLAYTLNGTSSQFEIVSFNNTIQLLYKVPYTPVGGEMTPGDGTVKPAALSQTPVAINGSPAALKMYHFGESNYVSIAEIAPLLNLSFAVDESGSIIINTP